MQSKEFETFQSRVISSFRDQKSPARLAVGQVLKDLVGTPLDNLKVAIKYCDVPHLTDSSTNAANIVSGKAQTIYYIVIYYWLHKAKSHTKFTHEIDKIVFKRIIRYADEFDIKPAAPFEWPKYVLKEDAETAEKNLSKGGGASIWLNPYNHHSIPFEGRDAEIKRLDSFIIAKDANFLITYIIAPSGAGKTRLVSQWMRKYVADPKDDECLEQKVAGWDAGLVVRRDAEEWRDWQPQCNTLIVIDYTYNYDEVIKAISEKAKECQNLDIRLLILDHLKPKNMSDDVAYGKATGDPRNRGVVGDFLGLEHSTITLTPDENSPQVLSKIIARVAKLFSSGVGDQPSDAIIQKATDALLAMGGENTAKASGERKTENNATHHPLFAALMGQTLGLNPDGDVTNLERRDLIDQYFNVDQRIPWKDSEQNAYWDNLGPWIGCYVSVATLLRGAEFDRLHQYLPPKFKGDLDKPEATDIISQISSRLVANEDGHNLKPFEPDILGETFFLKFLAGYKYHDDVMDEFYKMLGTFGMPEQENDAISNFLETIQRLVHNLINDDQETEFSEDAWRNLSTFLNPENFSKNSLLRQSVFIANGDVVRQLKQAEIDDEYIARFANKLNFSVLAATIYTQFSVATALSAIHYFDWISDTQSITGDTKDQFLSVLDNFNRHHKEPSHSLVLAAQEGSVQALNCIFSSEFDGNINQGRTNNGWTALMAACFAGHVDVVELLLNRSAKLNQGRTDNGWTALMVACQAGYIDVVELLLDRGAEVNQDRTDGDWTALRAACHEGCRDVVELLLDRGAEVNQGRTVNGRTALMTACQTGYVDVVELLLDRGAEVNQGRTDGGWTALMAASYAGHVDVVELLLNRHADVKQGKTDNGWTALMAACQADQLDVVKLLLDRGAEVNQGRTDDGWTALMAACYEGYSDVVELLLDRGAEVNQGRTNDGLTALMTACAFGHIDCVRILLEANADPTYRNATGITAAGLISNKDESLELHRLLKKAELDWVLKHFL